MSTMSELINPAHRSVSRSIGYALTNGDGNGWDMFTAVALLRLEDRERVALAYAALRALSPDHVAPVLDAALGRFGAGMPQSPLFNHMDQAAFWADQATPDEADAYCFASFNRMAPARQSAFLGFVHGRAAA